jgi:SAM-dependent methyltransferase
LTYPSFPSPEHERRLHREHQHDSSLTKIPVQKSIRGFAQRARLALAQALGRTPTEQALIRESSDCWNRTRGSDSEVDDFSHWRGAGPWQDEERWLALGRPHRRLYERLCRITGTEPRTPRIVEWGSGGGANAVHFIEDAKEFCGIEISRASLDECRRVLHDAGYDNFRGVLIDAANPEQALQQAGSEFDFFLCTYVFELIPGRRYGERIVDVAFRLLRPGGLALIQIRYDDGTERSSQKHAEYRKNCARFTSYRIEDFWSILERAGFVPEFVQLVPRQTAEYSGDLYAYFGMRRPAG